jgi:hypothetical protein
MNWWTTEFSIEGKGCGGRLGEGNEEVLEGGGMGG